MGRGGLEVCRGTSAQENLTSEASHWRLTDLWFQVFEWIKEILYLELKFCLKKREFCRASEVPRSRAAIKHEMSFSARAFL